MAAVLEPTSLEYTPTWIISVVCSIIVLISLLAERGLHQLGKCLKNNGQYALNEALDKLKGELMLLGFISLLLTVSQGPISNMCISPHHASFMLPCKLSSYHASHHTINNGRRLLSEANEIEYCARKGKVPLIPREAMHQLHIFIFVLAVVHVIFCVTTMCFGEMKMRLWKQWEDSIGDDDHKSTSTNAPPEVLHKHNSQFFKDHTSGYWRKYRPIGWMRSFFKQFYGSVTKSDYIALRSGFIQEHCPEEPVRSFHEYLLRSLEHDFEQIDHISWYLWLFVVLFLLLNLAGLHPYFWLSFLPLILLLLVGAHLERVITRLAREAKENKTGDGQVDMVKPSDKHFFCNNPKIILYLIHFILFQNSFEIAFFIWIWISYGIQSCMMEPTGLTIPRLVVGFIVQVLCSYSTLPLYALVTQMGCEYKQVIFNEVAGPLRAINSWKNKSFSADTSQTIKRVKEATYAISVVHHVDERDNTVCQAGTMALPNDELQFSCQNHEILPSP